MKKVICIDERWVWSEMVFKTLPKEMPVFGYTYNVIAADECDEGRTWYKIEGLPHWWESVAFVDAEGDDDLVEPEVEIIGRPFSLTLTEEMYL